MLFNDLEIVFNVIRLRCWECFMWSAAPPAEKLGQGWEMNVVSEEARREREQWLPSGDIRTVLSDKQPQRCAKAAQAWDVRAEMRWVGISLCLLSAALTLVSAALIAIRL